MDYDRLFSARAKSLPGSAFVHLIPMMKDPTTKVLCQGVPPDTTFPLSSLRATLKDGSEIALDAEEVVLAQRYPPFAWGPLRAWLLEHVGFVHRPPLPDWDLAVAAGSMSSVDLALAAFVDRGDIVLVEEFSFTASIDALKSYGAELVPLAMDTSGLRPDALEAACVKLSAEGRLGRAKMLYMVPVGHNPTGTTLASERYQAIYELARRFGLLIVEDDAYFYQQHTPRAGSPGEASGGQQGPPGLHSLGPSFLSLDVDGRVLRLDSFSKWLAPGFRLGWVSGARPLVEKYSALAYTSSQHGCSLSMMLVGKALQSWGQDGLDRHLRALQAALRSRCDALVAAAEEHLGDSAHVFQRPQAGMFLWVRLARCPESTEALLAAMRQHKVAVLPGSACSVAPRPQGQAEVPYVRLSFALGEEHYGEAARRFGGLAAGLP